MPFHDGPDPHQWPEAAPKMWDLVLDIEYLNRVIEVIDGPVAPEDEREHAEARDFLHGARSGQRAELARTILHSYRVELPELPTEAVGGTSGDSDGPGDRDHLRGVRG